MSELAAPCPNHRYGQVTFTCVRCGTFGCEACRSPVAGPLCSPCGARASMGLPVVETLQEALQFLLHRQNLLLAIAAGYLLFSLVQLGLSGRTFVLALLNGTFSTLVQAFVIRYVGNQLEDSESTLAEALSDSSKRLPAGLGSNLLVGLAAGLGILACIVPGLFLYLGLCLALPAVMLHGAGVIDSLKISWNLTEGARGPMCGVLLLTLAGCLLLSLVGVILLFVFSLLGKAGVVLGAMAVQAVSGMTVAFATTVLSFAYLKLAGVYTGERPHG